MSVKGKALEEVLRDFQRRAGRAQAPTLQSLVGRWDSFVEEAERGYELSIYDYKNDFSVRDLLAELLERVEPAIKEAVITLIESSDQRFRFATAQSVAPLNGRVKSLSWWWRCVPRVLKDELRSDLEAEGLL